MCPGRFLTLVETLFRCNAGAILLLGSQTAGFRYDGNVVGSYHEGRVAWC